MLVQSATGRRRGDRGGGTAAGARAGGRHGRKGTGPGMVYAPSLEHMYTSRQADDASPGRNCQGPVGYVAAGAPRQATATVENLFARTDVTAGCASPATSQPPPAPPAVPSSGWLPRTQSTVVR